MRYILTEKTKISKHRGFIETKDACYLRLVLRETTPLGIIKIKELYDNFIKILEKEYNLYNSMDCNSKGNKKGTFTHYIKQ